MANLVAGRLASTVTTWLYGGGRAASPGHGRVLLGLSLSILVGTFNPATVYGQDTDTAGSGAPASTTLSGGVVKVEVTLNNLRDARLSISRVRKATANLYDEMNRQQVTMNFNPNVVGSTVIMTPTPSFNGQLLPARRKWVDASMAEIGPIINLFKEDVDVAIETNRRTDVRDSTRETLDPIREDAFSSIKKSFALYKNLEELTGGAEYNNAAISSAAKNLDDEMKRLDKSLKRGTSILQKEAKLSKKKKVAAG